MNNYFSKASIDENTKNNQSNDVNRAIIMGNNSSANDDHDTQFGDLAQQLNDTSFFAG